MKKIEDFIEKNNLSFEEGNRNSTIVVLIGYSQHLGIDMYKLENQLEKQIEEDTFIQDEIRRLWDYCKNRNYASFWKTKEAKEKYKF